MVLLGSLMARRKSVLLPTELVSFFHLIESLIGGDISKSLKLLTTDELFEQIETRVQRLRFARRRGIPTSIMREASELGLFLAFFLHRMKETHEH